MMCPGSAATAAQPLYSCSKQIITIVKKLAFLLATLCCTVMAIAQTVTLRYEGANNKNASNARNFAVEIDGRTYYSANAEPVGKSAATQMVIGEPGLGNHEIVVYRINTNSNVSNTKGASVYNNTFRLRNGYDMIISIRRNGQVTFTEKKMAAATSTGATAAGKTAMSATAFTKLLESTKAKWSQSSRYTAVKSAFSNKANYFTTDQAGELLMLITSESKKLELAKLSYPRITDPENFSDTRDLFSAEVNKENLDKFILTKNPGASVSNNTSTSNNTNTTGYTPMATYEYNQLMTTVRNQYQQAGKYAVIRDAFSVTNNYFTTSQVRQLLTVITDESERLALAKMSYARVTDPANFSTLNNLFSTTANRNELSNFVRYGEVSTVKEDYSNRTVMSDGDFSKLHLKARLHIRAASVVEDVKEAFTTNTNYFSTDQIRALLTLIGSESDRLALAKLAYHRAADPTNFTSLSDLFTTQASIDAFNSYIRTNKS